MNHILNVSVSAHNSSKLDLRPVEQGHVLGQFLLEELERCNLSSHISIHRATDGALEEFAGTIRSLFDSDSDVFVVEFTHASKGVREPYHTFILAVTRLPLNAVSGGLPKLWQSFYGSLERLRLGENLSNWAFAFTIIPERVVGSAGFDDFSSLQLGPDGFNEKQVVNNSYSAWCDWNGGLLVVKRDLNVNKIVFALLITALKWELTETTYRSSLRLLDCLSSAPKERDAIRFEEELLRRHRRQVYFDNAMDKDLISYDQEDVAVYRLLEEGWELDRLSSRTVQLFEDINKITALAGGIDQRTTNKRTGEFLASIAIISFGGTVAGIISTVDFSNSLLASSLLRLNIILFLTTLTLLAFRLLLKRS